MLFVAITATGTAFLVKYSIQAISDASELKSQRLFDQDEIQRLSRELGKPPADVNNKIADLETNRPFTPQLTNNEERVLAG